MMTITECAGQVGVDYSNLTYFSLILWLMSIRVYHPISKRFIES